MLSRKSQGLYWTKTSTGGCGCALDKNVNVWYFILTSQIEGRNAYAGRGE